MDRALADTHVFVSHDCGSWRGFAFRYVSKGEGDVGDRGDEIQLVSRDGGFSNAGSRLVISAESFAIGHEAPVLAKQRDTLSRYDSGVRGRQAGGKRRAVPL